MKTSSSIRLIVALSIVLAAFTACKTAPPTPPPAPVQGSATIVTEGVPGGITVDTVTMTAKVTAIDYDKRTVTLLGSDGSESKIDVGPQAINFDQVKVGDLVKVKATEETVVFLGGQDSAASDGAAAMTAQAAKGTQPGGMVVGTMQVTGTVKELDPTHQMATLQFEDGSTKIFPVRDDIDLSHYRVGQKVVFQVTHMVAISVEKP